MSLPSSSHCCCMRVPVQSGALGQIEWREEGTEKKKKTKIHRQGAPWHPLPALRLLLGHSQALVVHRVCGQVLTVRRDRWQALAVLWVVGRHMRPVRVSGVRWQRVGVEGGV